MDELQIQMKLVENSDNAQAPNQESYKAPVIRPVKARTPLMEQYWSIKKDHPNEILLFRMGDFYEMFYEDAIVAAPILNIALTSRNKKAEDDTPMCGVPHHSIAGPISKLLAVGKKVAICDQLEDPELAKGIVRRGVTRVLSPGMVYDPENLDASASHFVAAFDDDHLSFLDATTGQAFTYELNNQRLTEALNLFSVLQPKEIILTEKQYYDFRKDLRFANFLTKVHYSLFDNLKTDWPSRFSDLTISASRLLTYAVRMQGEGVLQTVMPFASRQIQKCMSLSTHALRHLEVFQNYRGEVEGSLFNSIQRTKTSAGARCLKSYLQFPLVNPAEIEGRWDAVEEWTKKPADLKILRQALSGMGDIERRVAKISYSNCHVRDLVSLANSLRVGLSISPFCPALGESVIQELNNTVHEITNTLVDEPALNMKNGGYIRKGVSCELDELITLAENSQSLLLEMEAREKEKTQISSLKIRFNNVFGYYIEVTNTHKDKVPDHYKRKQTLANAERYLTEELHELETKILSSRERRVQVEEKIYSDLRSRILLKASVFLTAANNWAQLDVSSSLAWLAIEQNYCRPKISNDKNLSLESSRHPVVEQTVKKTFVPNHLKLSGGDCLLLTGPNMAGKSTLMRQVAITVLLAQMGSFVPARMAQLPIYKSLFTRIGASDSLSEGLSTFMVEMTETAQMLNSADENSLVVLDEVGRGTSTYDGMSLAQAILEHLVHESKATTLFATHYHEITQLSENWPQVKNAHMSVVERGNDVQFLYTLMPGPASKSYGIQVARLAGISESVVKRAQDLLQKHESRLISSVDRNPSPNEYSASAKMKSPVVLDPSDLEILKDMKNYNLNIVTPLRALQQIESWQLKLKRSPTESEIN